MWIMVPSWNLPVILATCWKGPQLLSVILMDLGQTHCQLVKVGHPIGCGDVIVMSYVCQCCVVLTVIWILMIKALCKDNGDFCNQKKTSQNVTEKRTTCTPILLFVKMFHFEQDYLKKILTWQPCFGTSSEINCGSPVVPENGGIVSSNSSYYTGIVTYRCDVGYRSRGELVSRCQRNGQWSSVPVCESRSTVSCKVHQIYHMLK